MSKLETLRSLQARIREATGPDRELDCIIKAVMDGRTIREENNMILARNSRAPHDEYLVGRIDPGRVQRNFTEAYPKPRAPFYTTDPDGLGACVALLHEVLPGWDWARVSWGFVSVHGNGSSLASRPLANDCLTFIDAIISAEIARDDAL